MHDGHLHKTESGNCPDPWHTEDWHTSNCPTCRESMHFRESAMTKESVYDDQIVPLMTQIIAICKEHKIANVCTFSLDRDENGERLLCTTAMWEDDFDPPCEYARIVGYLTRSRSPLMMTVEKPDGTKEITAFLD